MVIGRRDSTRLPERGQQRIGEVVRWKKILWAMLTVAAIAVWWVLNVEVTYERNVRHMPAAFRLERHADIRLWGA
jgi:hypothetical protein